MNKKGQVSILFNILFILIFVYVLWSGYSFKNINMSIEELYKQNSIKCHKVCEDKQMTYIGCELINITSSNALCRTISPDKLYSFVVD